MLMMDIGTKLEGNLQARNTAHPIMKIEIEIPGRIVGVCMKKQKSDKDSGSWEELRLLVDGDLLVSKDGDTEICVLLQYTNALSISDNILRFMDTAMLEFISLLSNIGLGHITCDFSFSKVFSARIRTRIMEQSKCIRDTDDVYAMRSLDQIYSLVEENEKILKSLSLAIAPNSTICSQINGANISQSEKIEMYETVKRARDIIK